MISRSQKNARRRLLVQTLEDRRLLAAGPYAPAAGIEGSDAISRTDPAIVGWASTVADYSPGTNVDAAWSNPANAIGVAEGEFDQIVSLGRGGSLTLTFNSPIRDGLGDDFAVFENSFSDTFLELGFVEVSSDGVNFHRFASDSRTDTALGSFDLLDPTNLHNLAGKYRAGFGTPFDLGELRGRSGLDVTAVTHVRLVDIVGDGNTTDASGDPIFDPTPTVGSAGLDVDGVAVIHAQATGDIVVDFETLGSELGGAVFDNGSSGVGSFSEQEITLNNNYNTTFQSWAGWSVSQSTDTTTAGFANQFGAITGIGNDNSSTYAVGFFDSAPSNPLPPPTITLDAGSGSHFDSFYVTNTTYATLSMQQGDGFAKKFGGLSGDDPDLLQLIVTGMDATGNSVGTVTVDLADYRFADNSQDFILDTWTKVDVSGLSDARSLQFSMTSTDSNGFGMLTPSYFAVDDVTLTRPAVAFDLSTPTTAEDQTVTGRISRSTADNSVPLTITLERTGSDAANFPGTVTIPSGVPFTDFSIVPFNDGVPTPNRSLEFTASAPSLLSTTRSLTIQDDEVLAVAFTPAVLNVTEGSGNSASLTLTRNDPDVSQPLAVVISNDTPSLLSIPANVNFTAGSRELVVPVTVLDNTQLDGNRTASVSATVAGRSTVTATVNIAEDDLPSLLANPTTIQLSENVPTASRDITIGRNTSNLTDPVTVTLTSLDGGPLNFPASVVIPAGAVSTVATIGVLDDGIQNALASYRIQATNPFYVSSVINVQVNDNDQAAIELDIADTSGSPISSTPEGTSFRVTLRRVASSLDQPQSIDLSALLDGVTSDRIVGPSQATIPAGSNQTTVSFSVTKNNSASDDLPLVITASTNGFVSASQTLQITDADLPVLDISTENGSLSENDAATVVDFETLGRGLLPGEFNNNAASPNGFEIGPIRLQNSFDNSFGFDSWSGFSVSRDNDSQTPGFFNQYSAFPGEGVDGSDTYGISFASSPVTITREMNSGEFDSLAITNTTYAALSMRDGDQFAKQFGGETGDDPDFFLLTIDGLDQDGNSIGQVEFYLADYRFSDNTQDYLIDEWTSVDLSSISEAVTLSMQLSSSDVGSFGMNTPGYFAIDDIALQPNTTDSATPSRVTVTRSGTSVDEALTVSLATDRDDVKLPTTVVIPAGVASIDVLVDWRDDNNINGERTLQITADADGFASTSETVALIDNDVATLTLNVSSTELNEANGVQTIGFEDVGAALADESFDNGANRRGGFASGSLAFSNAYDPTFGSWSGWAYSNVTDVITPGFGNQFASYAGEGAQGSDTFAIAGGYGASPPTIVMPDSFDGATFDSIAITNTTYAALSMLQGDAFAKKFGGETGDDADFFLLTIEGFDSDGEAIGETEFYLADYRFEDNSLDYIVDQWTVVDLSSLADAQSLEFRLSSSDVGTFGMNTPAYFAIDQLVINRSDAVAPSITVHRNLSDLSSDATVSVDLDPESRLHAPATIVIPSGSDRVRVPLTIVDDALYQDDAEVDVTVAADGFASATQKLNVQNDEAPGILILNSEQNFALTEGGPASALSVRLESAPTSDVTVSVSGDLNELEIPVETLTFTPDNWSQTQTLLISGRPDLTIDAEAVIPVAFTSDDFVSAHAWFELADYQPEQVSLIHDNGKVLLVDDRRRLTFEEFVPEEDIQVTLNDAGQRFTLERIAGAGGLIEVNTAGGDDVVEVSTKHFTSIDGAEGQDTLIIAPQDLEPDETLDVAQWLQHRAVRFETIVLGSADSSDDISMRFALDSSELKSWFGATPPRLITSSNQILNLSGNWQLGLPTLEDGVVTGRLVGEGIEVTVSTQRPWQNFLMRADVNASGDVTASDALTVINRLNADPTSELPVPGSIDELQGQWVDVSGDGQVTAIDALQVINYLNEMEADGESVFADGNVLPVVAVSSRLTNGKPAAERPDEQAITESLNEKPEPVGVVVSPETLPTASNRHSPPPKAAAVDVALAELGLLLGSIEPSEPFGLGLADDFLDNDS